MRATLSILVIGAFALVSCRHTSPADAPVIVGAEEGERENSNPGGVSAWVGRRLSESGTLPADAIERMLAERDAMPARFGGASLTNWRFLGPTNIGGRIRALVYHPTSPNTMWAGAANGGVWKTTDAGQNWNPLDNFPTVLPIGCLAVDPADSNRVLAGTGEGVFNSIPGTSILAAPRGAGIWETTDGGTSWSRIPSTTGSNWHFVNRLAFHPTTSNIVLAATSSGIWRSADRGASWSRRISGADVFDVQFDPNNGNNAVAGGRNAQALYSRDAGVSWLSSSGAASPDRIELEYAKSAPGTVYAAVSSGGRIKVYRSTNGGASYALAQQGSGIQTWSRYNNALWVDPTNANTLLVGGVRLYRSTDAGRVFIQQDSGLHVDHHIMVSHPSFNGINIRTVAIGHDGGVSRTNNVNQGTISWTSIENGLGCTQFYGAAVSPTTGTILAGAQDNGTLRYAGAPNTWTTTFGGDGGFCAADPNDPNFFYGEVQNLRIFRSTDGGNNASYIDQGINEADPNFIPPFILDPNDSKRMLAGGARLWRTNNVRAGTVSWTTIKASICTGFGGSPGHAAAHFSIDPLCNISAIAVAKGNSNQIWVGHNNGNLYKTTNGTAASPLWIRVDDAGPSLPNRWISRIAVDPCDPNKVYVTFMGYANDNVWRTDNGGQRWIRITGTGPGALPSAPVTSIAVHRALPGLLYAGTDAGLFCSTDDGVSWTSTTGNVGGRSPIEELVWKNARELMIVTHGRGIFLADTAPFASMRPIGFGCGIGRSPRLLADPPIPGSTTTFRLTRTAASALVTFALAPAPTLPTALGNNCTLYMNLAVTALLPGGRTDSTGSWQLPIRVPPIPSTIGATFSAQAFVNVPGGPAFGVGELSNGVELTIGL